jgi:hypothetical protein
MRLRAIGVGLDHVVWSVLKAHHDGNEMVCARKLVTSVSVVLYGKVPCTTRDLHHHTLHGPSLCCVLCSMLTQLADQHAVQPGNCGAVRRGTAGDGLQVRREEGEDIRGVRE